VPFSNFVGLNIVTPPALNCVSVADFKAHGRVFIDADDSVIAGYLWTAMIACEDRTKRAFMPQTWQLALSQWPGRTPALGPEISSNPQDYWRWNHFEVPKPPLVSVVSFQYFDTMYNVYNMTQVGPPPLPSPDPMAGNYILQTYSEPGEIQLPFAGIWPTTVLIPGVAIVLVYNCGFSAFAGQMNVDENGVCTPAGSPANTFDPSIVGTWITVTDQNGNTGSFTVAQWTSGTQVQLQVQVPSPITFPGGPYSYTGNNVWMPIRQAILLIAAHYYENREPIVTGRSETAIEVPTMYDALLAPYTIYRS
jgi:hypothetical protein